MSETAPVSMVDRVVLILEAFQRGSATLSLADIAEVTRLPRSSTHRIVQQLLAARWLDRCEGGYRLGLGIFELGSLVADRNRIVTAARPFMQQLSAGRYVVHVGMRDDRDVVYLDKVGGPFAGKLPSRIGGRLPAHCTGVGKAILAYSEPEVVDAYFSGGLEARTPHSLADPTLLRSALRKIRAVGLAFDLSEAVEGVECVAAPLFDTNGVCAAISVSGPTGHVDQQLLGRSVRMAAIAISRRLGGAHFAIRSA
ncbi:IclR family transcriptional regulator [Microbacterium sp. NC79]|uniref:IclR family transcriptional regulator n=1 Tax=Microbacterium sp. NC79 TaxID=2851009 RepID=UPI001C2C15A7|nr:IclR family transcriptional regulator [Microbacterium sp. NC79]MBV0893692.1 IclR family transcriptional regulator [Microbacterium sp. NC79]